MKTQQLFSDLLASDDISWKALILDAVHAREMNPWDIDITQIASEFIAMLAKLKEMNFKLSGKVILASALMLKIKSDAFIHEDIGALDRIIASGNESEILDSEPLDEEPAQVTLEKFGIFHRTPQPRKRKVSVYDLIEALEKALDVDQRRLARKALNIPVPVQVPKRTFDITQSLQTMQGAIKEHYAKSQETLTFFDLASSQSRLDKIYTFIPLLHLRNMHEIDLHQAVHFENFSIELLKKQATSSKNNV